MSKELIEFDVFDAGLNTKADPINLLPGQSYDMNNIVFGDYGAIKSRQGIATHNSVAMGSSGIQGLISYQPSTMSAQMLAICSGSLHVMTGASTTPVLITAASGYWAASHYQVEMEQMNEKVFISTPGRDPTKFNGKEFTKAGIQPPTQVLTAACAGAGSMTGGYQYVYWGVNSYAAEGDYIATPSNVKTITSGFVQVTNIPIAPAIDGIEYWKVGRNTAGAEGIFWYLTDVVNGSTSFIDATADSILDTLAPTDQGYPRRFQNMCVYGGRLWGSVDDILWYSNINQPEEFPSTNFIRVGQGMGMGISAIAPFMGMIVVSLSGWRDGIGLNYSERTQLYVLRIGDSIGFNDPENWYLNLIADGVGSESHRACITMAGYLWIVSRNGVSLFNGSSIVSAVQDTSAGGVVAQRISDAIAPLFDLDNKSDIRAAAAIEWKDRVYLSVAGNRLFSTTTPVNVRTLVYDYMRVGKADPTRGAWSKFNTPAASKFIIHEGGLYGGGPNLQGSSPNNSTFSLGYIHRWDNGNDYDKTSGTTNIKCPDYCMAPIWGKKNHVYNDKDFRVINIWASGVGLLYVTAIYESSGETFSLDSFDTATTFYQTTFTLSAGGSKHIIKLPSGVTGKNLWLRFQVFNIAPSNDVDLTITKVQVFYNLRGLRNA